MPTLRRRFRDALAWVLLAAGIAVWFALDCWAGDTEE